MDESKSWAVGAGSVLQHVVANNGRTKPQLFRGAITSSTFLPSQYQFNDRIPEVGAFIRPSSRINSDRFQMLFSEVVAQTKYVACSLKFNDGLTSLSCTAASNAIACLRAADATVLQTANTNINHAGFFGTFTIVPVIDGTFITQRPTLSLLERKVNGVR